MKQRFEFEFEDESESGTISFDYDPSDDEKMGVSIEDGVPVIYANRAALLVLAKTLIKMAVSRYPDGFHVHLEEDFNADRPEILRVILNDPE